MQTPRKIGAEEKEEEKKAALEQKKRHVIDNI